MDPRQADPGLGGNVRNPSRLPPHANVLAPGVRPASQAGLCRRLERDRSRAARSDRSERRDRAAANRAAPHGLRGQPDGPRMASRRVDGGAGARGRCVAVELICLHPGLGRSWAERSGADHPFDRVSRGYRTQGIREAIPAERDGRVVERRGYRPRGRGPRPAARTPPARDPAVAAPVDQAWAARNDAPGSRGAIGRRR